MVALEDGGGETRLRGKDDHQWELLRVEGEYAAAGKGDWGWEL